MLITLLRCWQCVMCWMRITLDWSDVGCL